VLLALAAGVTSAQVPPRIPEYQAKATILKALGNYTRWPGGRVQNKAFTIGILGSSPFGRHLEAQVRNQQVRGQGISLLPMHSPNPGQIQACDILFICESESDRLSEVLAHCQGRPILTIGDTPGYGHRGVMLNFTFAAHLLGLEVNLQAIKGAGLEVSSSFLTLAKAKVVEPS
jgi:hypothetical protein